MPMTKVTRITVISNVFHLCMIGVHPAKIGRLLEEMFCNHGLVPLLCCTTHNNALHTCAVILLLSHNRCIKIHLITEQTRITVLISRGTSGCYQAAQLDVTKSTFIKTL